MPATSAVAGVPGRGADDPLFRLSSPEPGRPALLTSFSSAAIGSGSGDLALSWEARGAPMEWGGVYAQGIRLTGAWRTRFRIGSDEWDVPTTLTELAVYRWGLRSRHRFGGVEALQEVVPIERSPGVGRRWAFSTNSASPIHLTVLGEFEPFLAPIIVEGFKPYDYEVARIGTGFEVSAASLGLALAADPAPFSVRPNGEAWDGERRSLELRLLTYDHHVDLSANAPARLTWCIVGGSRRDLKHHLESGRLSSSPDSEWTAGPSAAWNAWQGRCPRLRTPDAPALERAYALACGALRALYAQPAADLTGMAAGYPWYSTIWGRDLAWMLPAVLWTGDYDWARDSLDTMLRFQAPTRLVLLAAEAGELPMQLSAGPVFLYGTSDSTLHYPSLVRRYLDHSGRRDDAARWYPAVAKAMAWGRARMDATSGLVRNGGELSHVMSLARYAKRFDFGIDAHDTTIWDSTDRRDHAIDVQVLWHRALVAQQQLARTVGEPADETPAAQDALRVARSIREKYRWSEEGYLYDSLKVDGTPVAHLRPNALLAISDGLLDGGAGTAAVNRMLRPDIRTAWGIRTLSAVDPGYVPTAYHDGQVWGIATAWAAHAAFVSGDSTAGVDLLTTMAELVVAESGLANECYRGDRPQPFNSCFLLGLTVGPFLSTIFEGLWGLAPEAAGTALRVAPRFPPTWHEAHLTQIRVGRGLVDLHWSDGALEARLTSDSPLEIQGPSGTISLAPGASATVTAPSAE